MASGGAHATAGNGHDSDNNAADFVQRASGEPPEFVEPRRAAALSARDASLVWARPGRFLLPCRGTHA